MITLTQPTPTILPTYNRVLYKIVSDMASEVGFKYVVKLYNGNNELITTAYYDTPPNSALEVEFDVSKFISTYYDFQSGIAHTGTIGENSGIIFPFYLKCYEYYAVAGTYQIVTGSEVVSATKYGFAGALPLLELREYYQNYQNYNGDSTSVYKPLTDWTSIRCRSSDAQYITFINNGKITNLELVVTNSLGAIQTYYINSPTPTGHTATIFNVTPMTYGNVQSIEVFINWSNGGARRYKVCDIIVQSCGKYEPIRVGYLNKYGAYDYINFDLINRTSFNTERRSYLKEYSGDIYVDGTNIVKSIDSTYYTKETQRWKLVSDYLTDEQAYMVRDLYSSPLVYAYIVNDNSIIPSWIPIKPQSNTYELKTIVTDKIFNLEFEAEYAITNTRQSV